MKTRTCNRGVIITHDSSNWSHTMICHLLTEAKTIGSTADRWFFFPPSPGIDIDTEIKPYMIPSFTEFQTDLYTGKARVNLYALLKETGLFQNNQLTTFKFRNTTYVVANFYTSPTSLPKRNILDSFNNYDMSPTWAERCVDPTYTSNLISPDTPNQIFFGSEEDYGSSEANTPLSENIIQPIDFLKPGHNKVTNEENIEKDSDAMLENLDEIMKSIGNDMIIKWIQSNPFYIGNLLETNPELMRCILFQTNPCFMRCLFKNDPELMSYIDDSSLLLELLRRTKMLSTSLKNRVEHGRLHFNQPLKDMNKKTMNKFIGLATTLINASLRLIHNVEEDVVKPVNILSMFDWKSNQSDVNLGFHERHSTAIFEEIRCWKPKERRPLVSFLTTVSTKREAEEIGKLQFSKYEWQEAKKHGKFPGVGKPIPKIFHRRCRLSHKVLVRFFDVLSDGVQRYAFGTKVLKLLDEFDERIESIKTNKCFQSHFVHYVREVFGPFLDEFVSADEKSKANRVEADDKDSDIEEDDSNEDTSDEDDNGEDVSANDVSAEFCKPCSPSPVCACPITKVGLRCLKQLGHDGRHKFTDKSEIISLRTCRRLLDLLTTGNMKSLMGLDDEDVRGRDNWAILKQLVSKLTSLTNISDDHAIIELIIKAEDFHVADFISHIKDTSNAEKFNCCCLPCGFYCQEDPIECRNSSMHVGVCSKCTESFAIFPIIQNLIDIVKMKQEKSLDLEEEIRIFEFKLKNCRQTLIDYRAHLVLKFDEREWDKHDLLSLQPHQAIVISDWKMKILQSFYRETQQEFFGKRGTSMIGFMVISKHPNIDDDDDRVNNVEFHFLLTDDTTQDHTAVNAAKCIVYKMLPTYVKEVLFRSDGAGCFSCNATRAAILYWEIWSGVKEVSNRQSPAGGGKTNLDGAFGVVQRKLTDANNRGYSYHDSDSIINAIESSTPIKASTYHVWKPERDVSLCTKLKGFNQYSKVALVEGGVRRYKHSGRSVGEFIPFDEIDRSWTIDEEGSDGYDQLKSTPPTPRYQLLRSSQKGETSLLPSEPVNYLERDEMMKRDMIDKHNKELLKKEQAKIQNITEKLYPCTTFDGARRCRKAYQTKLGLDRHLLIGPHDFPRLTGLTIAARMAAGESGLLSIGTFVNRSSAIQRHIELCSATDLLKHLKESSPLSSAAIQLAIDDRDWHQPGCFNKPKRKQVRRLNQVLKSDLVDLFDQGIKTNKKFNAEIALKTLSEYLSSDGTKKYTLHPDNPNGPLPDVDQITHFFSSESSKRKKEGLMKADDSDEGSYEKLTMMKIKDILIQKNLPSTPSTSHLFKEILAHHNKLEEFHEENEDGDFLDWTVAELKQEINKRQLNISTPKAQLVTLLTMADALDVATVTITDDNNDPREQLSSNNNDRGSYAKLKTTDLQRILSERQLPIKNAPLLKKILILHDGASDDSKYSSWAVKELTDEIGNRGFDISSQKKKLTTLLTLSDYHSRSCQHYEQHPQDLNIETDTAKKEREEESAKHAQALLRPLSDAENEIVKEALYGEGSPHDILARLISESSRDDFVQRESIQRLRPGMWLNDEVIHYFYMMLANRDAQLVSTSPDSSQKRCHFFKSFLMTKLLDEGVTNKYTYNNVKRWSKNVPGNDVFGLSKIFIPVNMSNVHWACVAIFLQERRIQFYDSMGGDGMYYMKALLQYLKDEWASMNNGQELPNSTEWRLVSCTSDTPQQKNGFDCGVFTCMFADFLSMGRSLSFTQDHVTRCRERIALSILQGCAIR